MKTKIFIGLALLGALKKLVEPLYEMDKDGRLSGDGEKGMQDRPFLEDQIAKAAQMLGNLWLTAWLDAPEDPYLQKTLQQRHATGSSNPN
jgi:hypothetical protein